MTLYHTIDKIARLWYINYIFSRRSKNGASNSSKDIDLQVSLDELVSSNTGTLVKGYFLLYKAQIYDSRTTNKKDYRFN